jgi:hypothetical protein
MQELTFIDVVAIELKRNITLQEAVENALSLCSGGAFDAVEGDKRQAIIKKAMDVVPLGLIEKPNFKNTVRI